jgi:hypothetical protein
LDSTAIRTLEAIGAIFDDSTIENQTKSWIAHLERCRNELRQQNWAVVRSLYNPAGALTFKNWVEYMQPYYRHTGKLANRIEQHNEILCRSFHSEFSKILVPLFPEPVKPSYCFLGIYHNQARLPKHIDREQCQWNVSVILDSSPNITDLDDSWPIYLEPVPNKYVELRATIGDAVIYRGNKMPHWRDRLPARFNQVSICFFHYVHQDFAGSLD